jgi:hypothetical protein
MSLPELRSDIPTLDEIEKDKLSAPSASSVNLGNYAK